MVQVDIEAVFMLQDCVPVRMAMRLRALPALVRMRMVFIVDVQVFVLQRLVQMLEIGSVVMWPCHHGSSR